MVFQGERVFDQVALPPVLSTVVDPVTATIIEAGYRQDQHMQTFSEMMFFDLPHFVVKRDLLLANRMGLGNLPVGQAGPPNTGTI